MNTKYCNGCGQDLPTTEFWKSHTTKDRLQSQCKHCQESKRKAKIVHPWDRGGWCPITGWVFETNLDKLT